MAEQQWIDWFPKVGDIKPEKYRIRFKDDADSHWALGCNPLTAVDTLDHRVLEYQIPAPVVTPAEYRPPWIDPQCKFRWGDRVKCKYGTVRFVIHPRDPDPDLGYRRVIAAASLSAAVPYATYKELKENGVWYSDRTLGILVEEDLTLFPEDLPKHFDDRILDADQPQEQPKTARVPREIWVNHRHTVGYGFAWDSQLGAESAACDGCETVHFREVL